MAKFEGFRPKCHELRATPRIIMMKQQQPNDEEQQHENVTNTLSWRCSLGGRGGDGIPRPESDGDCNSTPFSYWQVL
jgi:hypothetical protein